MSYGKEKIEMFGWLMFLLGCLLIVCIVGFITNGFGLLGRTILERKVFEESYQYSESQKQQVAIFKAQLAELQGRINDPNLNESTRSEIEGQRAAIRIQLQALQIVGGR